MSVRRLVTVTVALAVAMALAVPAGAAPPAVSITGGGQAQNNNSGAGDLVGIGGFTAKELADGSFTGQLQLRTVAAGGDLASQIHGTVVCLAATTAVGAGGEGWEIRFEVTSSTGLGAVLAPVGGYGSIFVQDNPDGVDMVDESFDDLTNAACGDNDDDVTWEPLLHGDIKVTDRN